jgi:hypothetical protein
MMTVEGLLAGRLISVAIAPPVQPKPASREQALADESCCCFKLILYLTNNITLDQQSIYA